MNREEFLRKLEAMLDGISQGEKAEALQYYNDYFEDAGIENEQEVMASLESPETVAKTIKAGLDEKAADAAETLSAEKTAATGSNSNHGNDYQQSSQYNNQQHNTSYSGAKSYPGTGASQEQIKKETSPWKIVAIVLLCIILSPVILPLAGAAFGIVVGILGTLFGIIVGFGAAGVALIFAGAVVFGLGIVKLFVVPIAGLCILGAGLILVALGIIFILMTVWICGWLVPLFIKAIVKLCKMPFQQRGAYVA